MLGRKGRRGMLFVKSGPLSLGMRFRHCFSCERVAPFSRFSATSWAFKFHWVQHSPILAEPPAAGPAKTRRTA